MAERFKKREEGETAFISVDLLDRLINDKDEIVGMAEVPQLDGSVDVVLFDESDIPTLEELEVLQKRIDEEFPNDLGGY